MGAMKRHWESLIAETAWNWADVRGDFQNVAWYEERLIDAWVRRPGTLARMRRCLGLLEGFGQPLMGSIYRQ